VSSAVQNDGTFAIDRFYLGAEYAVTVTGLPGDHYMRSAKLGTLDVLEGGTFHLDSLARLGRTDRFEVTLGGDGGSVKGTVFGDADDRTVPDAAVVLIPDERRRRRPDQYRRVAADKLGNFTVRGVPPGNYSLIAWRRLEANAHLNAAYLAPYEVHGAPVAIQPGANAPVGLRVVPDR
jgi:hypothetical protein